MATSISFTTILGHTVLSLIAFTVLFTTFLKYIVNSKINCSSEIISSNIDNVYDKLKDNEDLSGVIMTNSNADFRNYICDNNLRITKLGAPILYLLLVMSLAWYIFLYNEIKYDTTGKDFFIIMRVKKI